METDKEILFREMPGEGGDLGVITLNRPKALNALTHSMCLSLDLMLRKWATDTRIKAIVIYGMGDKAFSAGGDIRYLYDKGKAGDYAATSDFFRDEYRMNHLIHNYPKPFIALLDGITMGGGVGVSIHGSHRIVTERFLFAMPETTIGFFPDIGGSYFLSRCPGETGVYLGLVGARLNAAEAMYAELADHFIFSSHLHELVTTTAKTRFSDDPFQTVTRIMERMSITPETPRLAVYRDNIDTCFGMDTVEEIITALQHYNRQWHQETLATLLKKSPTSLKVALREIREGVGLDFDSCMEMEFRLCQRFMQGHDFYEGIRAVLIDKDNTPFWEPNRLSEITPETVDSYFAPLPENEELTFNNIL